MLVMGFQNSETAYTVIDLERGLCGSASEPEGYDGGSSFSNGQIKLMHSKDLSNFDEKKGEESVELTKNFSNSLCGRPTIGEGLAEKTPTKSMGFRQLQKMDLGMPRKKTLEKSPKPPRPPRSFSLDAADRKLIEEISKLAKLKHARNERRKALKKMNTTEAESSNNLGAIIVTIIFCLVILWQVIWDKYLSLWVSRSR